MWELDYEESWALKKWCFWTVVLEKTLESPLDCKGIKPVNPKGDQFWIYIGKTNAEADTPILWPPDVKCWLIGKDPDTGKDGQQEEKGMTEDEMVGWHHWLDGHEFEQALGVGDGQWSLVSYSSWGCKESDMTEWLNWTELNWIRMEFLSCETSSCSHMALYIQRWYWLGSVASFADNWVACSQARAQQGTLTLMPTEIYIVMSRSVSPIVLRPVLGIVLTLDSVLPNLEQLMSWLQPGLTLLAFFPFWG